MFLVLNGFEFLTSILLFGSYIVLIVSRSYSSPLGFKCFSDIPEVLTIHLVFESFGSFGLCMKYFFNLLGCPK